MDVTGFVPANWQMPAMIWVRNAPLKNKTKKSADGCPERFAREGPSTGWTSVIGASIRSSDRTLSNWWHQSSTMCNMTNAIGIPILGTFMALRILHYHA